MHASGQVTPLRRTSLRHERVVQKDSTSPFSDGEPWWSGLHRAAKAAFGTMLGSVVW